VFYFFFSGIASQRVTLHGASITGPLVLAKVG